MTTVFLPRYENLISDVLVPANLRPRNHHASSTDYSAVCVQISLYRKSAGDDLAKGLTPRKEEQSWITKENCFRVTCAVLATAHCSPFYLISSLFTRGTSTFELGWNNFLIFLPMMFNFVTWSRIFFNSLILFLGGSEAKILHAAFFYTYSLGNGDLEGFYF